MLRLHCINEASQVKISLRTILWKSDPGYCAYMITWHSGMCEKRKLDFHGISEIMATSWPGKIGLNHVWRLYTPSMKKVHVFSSTDAWPSLTTTLITEEYDMKPDKRNSTKNAEKISFFKWILIPSVFPVYLSNYQLLAWKAVHKRAGDELLALSCF